MGGVVQGLQVRVLHVLFTCGIHHIKRPLVVTAHGYGAVTQNAVAGAGGDVYIPNLIGGTGGGQQLCQNTGQVFPCIVVAAQVVLGQGNGGDAAHESFHGRAHRAGVGNVIAHIVAVVDAGEHHVRLFGHNGIQRCPDAVGRSAVQGIGGHAIHAPFVISQPHGTIQRDAVGHGAALAGGCHHSDIAELRSGLRQKGNARGIDAVIVGN